MPSNSLIVNSEYQDLLQHVGETLENGRAKAVAAVNSAVVTTYWEIGRDIVEFEQAGSVKAEYGTEQTTNYYTVYMGVLHVPVRFRNCTVTCCFTFDQLAERLPSVVLHPDTTIAPTVSFVQG